MALTVEATAQYNSYKTTFWWQSQNFKSLHIITYWWLALSQSVTMRKRMLFHSDTGLKTSSLLVTLLCSH